MGKRPAISVVIVMAIASTLLVVGAMPAFAAVSFDPQVTYSAGLRPASIGLGDFDGDNITDLAVTNSGSNDISIFPGNADGTFDAPIDSAVGGGAPQSVAVGNFNAGTGAGTDAFLDLATANGGDNTVSVLLGTGTGTFQAPIVFDSGGFSPVSISTGDFDSDTSLDLAVANAFSDPGVSIMLGDGLGSFAAATVFAAGSSPASIATGNFDAGSDLDLAVANIGSDDVSILLGDGAGSFGAPANFSVGSGPASITTGLFDADAIVDLAIANSGSNDVSILLGDGAGSFTGPNDFAVGSAPRSVGTADFDGDGLADLAVRNTGANTVSILVGNGAGSFAPGGTHAVDPGPGRLATEDFDGDSRIDLAVANEISDNVSILLNSSPPAAPMPTSSSPSSPADDNNPLIIGTAPVGSFVFLYTDAACSGVLAAIGTAAEFAAPGIAVSVADNTTTTFYAIASDGSDSPCSSASVTYEEVTVAPPPPSPPPPPPPSPTPSPTPTVEPPPSPGVHIGVSNLTPKLGNTFVVTTWLDDCPGNELTTIELETRDGAEWNNAGSISLDADCRARWRKKADFTSRAFRTFWPQQNDDHSSGYSGIRTVTTKDSLPGPRVKMLASDRTPVSGEVIVFDTRIGRCAGLEGDKLQLYRLMPGLKKEDAERDENLIVMSDGVYQKLATQRVDENCRTAFEVKANFETATFKSIWPKQDPRYRRGHSKASVIVAH